MLFTLLIKSTKLLHSSSVNLKSKIVRMRFECNIYLVVLHLTNFNKFAHNLTLFITSIWY